jgi:cytochrome c oxidase subunit 2
MLLALCSCARSGAVLNPAGPQAAVISKLWWAMLCTAVGVYALTMLALLFAVARKKAHRDVDTAERLAKVLVGGAVAVTAVILTTMIGLSFLTGRSLYSLHKTDALTIRITGHQWWWQVEYDDPVKSNIFYTANEIYIPVGEPVRLELRSVDVIHSLWIPNLHGKMDLIPGYTREMWIQADRTGEFRGACAEFCGVQHAHMNLLVVAKSRPDFDAWVARQRLPATAPSSPEQIKGRDLFVHTSCGSCHSIAGTDAGGRAGPDLTHVMSRKFLAAGALPTSKGSLGGWIVNSLAIKPGNKMPQHTLPPDELHALLAYLETLQ